ncbi:hypothetical protein MKW92_029534, partial [Papaver armeniacum]
MDRSSGLITSSRGEMNNVLDRWETCPAKEKRLVICQYLDDVKKNVGLRSYSNPADFDAEMEILK